MAFNTVYVFAYFAILLFNIKLCRGSMRYSHFAVLSETDRH